jgi:lysozyme
MKAPNPKLLAAAVPLAVSLLVGVEGYSATPYRDIVGVLTNCYGNTHDVRAGVVSTKAECQTKLAKEVTRIATSVATDDANHADRMSSGNLAAVTSWRYNVGDRAYETSTLRKDMFKGDYVSMCYELPRWNKVSIAGALVPSPGLDNRRAKELKLCLSPSPGFGSLLE